MSRYFKAFELSCPCCDKDHFDHNTLDKLDSARADANIPFVVNSAYRCPKHNKKVGGVKNSAHVAGKAIDISATTSRERYIIIRALMVAGFNRIGVYKTFIHADDDPSKPKNMVWHG